MTDLVTFLQPYPPEMRQLVYLARELILEVMPGMIELFDPSANLIGYGIDRTYKGLVCGIIIYHSYFNLMFARGASLPDPDGLLSGTGKKARHIRIAREADLRAPGVRQLLESARQAQG